MAACDRAFPNTVAVWTLRVWVPSWLAVNEEHKLGTNISGVLTKQALEY